MKETHRKILNKLEEYLNKEGSEHLRFTQALFNIDINSQVQNECGFFFRDNHNDADIQVLHRISKHVPDIPKEILYRYEGNDWIHLQMMKNGFKNYYTDTKENIMAYLDEQMEFEPEVKEDEIKKMKKQWFKTYCKKVEN